jgi:hypothetical protein
MTLAASFANNEMSGKGGEAWSQEDAVPLSQCLICVKSSYF